MQINKHSSDPSKRTLYLVGVVIGLIALGIVSYLAYRHYHSSFSGTSTPDTATTDSPETKKQNTSSKEDFINNVKLPDQGNQTDSSTTKPKDLSSTVSMELSQQDGDVIVSTKLPDFSDGTCEITATNGAKAYSAKADVLYQPSYSTCMGFNIPISELGSGTWSVRLEAKGSAATAQTTKTIEVTQ